MKRLLPLLIALIVSCETSEEDDSEARQKETARIEDSLNHTVPVLKGTIIKLLSEDDFAGVKATIAELKTWHPDAPEVVWADSIGAGIDQIIVDREQKYKDAFSSLLVETDDMTGTKWYRDKSSPIYVNTNGFFLYFTSAGSFNLKIQYYGDDWLFIKSYTIKTDNNTYTLTPDEVDRDNDTEVWEWCSFPVSSHCAMVKDIANSSSVKYRMNGKDYYKDVELTKTQRNAFKNALYGYWGSGGKTCK